MLPEKRQALATILRGILPQLALLAVASALAVLARLGVLPSTEELGAKLKLLMGSYGLGMIAVLSFLENLPGVNVYFPGSIVILGAMAAAAGNPMHACLVFVAIVLPAILANVLCFYGGVRARGMNAPLQEWRNGRSLWLWYAATYWHPHFAAVSAFASGAGGVRFREYLFHFLPVSISWVAFWSFVMYKTGESISVTENLVPLALAYIVVWLMWDLYRMSRRGHSGRAE